MQLKLHRQAIISIHCPARPSLKSTSSRDSKKLSASKVGCSTAVLWRSYYYMILAPTFYM